MPRLEALSLVMNIDRTQISFSEQNQTRGQRHMTLSDAEKNPKILKIGEGKGLTFSFRNGEILVLPKPEECMPFFKTFNGQDIMYVGAYSLERKRFVELPVSTFRRIPAGEGEVDSFYDEDVRPLNCELSMMANDLQRLRRICELGSIQCTEIVEAHRPVFEKDADGNFHRVDGKFRKLYLVTVKPVSEVEEAA